MAARDYIRCSECECKMIPDGDDTGRDYMELKWGDPDARIFTASVLCPDCVATLRQQLAESEARIKGDGIIEAANYAHEIFKPLPDSSAAQVLETIVDYANRLRNGGSDGE